MSARDLAAPQAGDVLNWEICPPVRLLCLKLAQLQFMTQHCRVMLSPRLQQVLPAIQKPLIISLDQETRVDQIFDHFADRT